MMNTMQRKVDSKGVRMVREVVVKMEKETMHGVFEEGPHKITEKEAGDCLSHGSERWRC